MEIGGLEPLTYALRTRRSPAELYPRILIQTISKIFRPNNMYYATFVFEMQQVTKPFAGKVIDFSCSGT